MIFDPLWREDSRPQKTRPQSALAIFICAAKPWPWRKRFPAHEDNREKFHERTFDITVIDEDNGGRNCRIPNCGTRFLHGKLMFDRADALTVYLRRRERKEPNLNQKAQAEHRRNCSFMVTCRQLLKLMCGEKLIDKYSF
jgi:hypothetical protein